MLMEQRDKGTAPFSSTAWHSICIKVRKGVWNDLCDDDSEPAAVKAEREQWQTSTGTMRTTA